MDEATQELLDAPLDESRVHPPPPGKFGDYLEAWDDIETANRIFGYDGWSFQVLSTELHTAHDRNGAPTGQFYSAQGIVTAIGQTKGDIGTNDVSYRREDGHASPDAHATAIKGAASDCLKRCLRHFGDQFGNSLYDKDRKVRAKSAPTQAARPPAPPPREQAVPTPDSDYTRRRLREAGVWKRSLMETVIGRPLEQQTAMAEIEKWIATRMAADSITEVQVVDQLIREAQRIAKTLEDADEMQERQAAMSQRSAARQ